MGMRRFIDLVEGVFAKVWDTYQDSESLIYRNPSSTQFSVALRRSPDNALRGFILMDGAILAWDASVLHDQVYQNADDSLKSTLANNVWCHCVFLHDTVLLPESLFDEDRAGELADLQKLPSISKMYGDVPHFTQDDGMM